MGEPHVVVVGSINMDFVVRADRLPRRGETVIGGDLERRPGGKGANQAVAARRLGARSSLVGRVGLDEVGPLLCQSLADSGVELDGLEHVSGATGVALVVVDADGENLIAVAPGVNGSLDLAEAGALIALLDTADALLLQLEIPVAAAAAAARLARARGVPIVLNAAPIPSIVDDWLLALAAAADIVVVNQTEAARLAAAASARPAPDGSRPLPAALRELGVDEVVVTCGESGAVLIRDASPPQHVAGFVVEAADTVGAGDAFCAELAVAIAAKITDRTTAVERACAAGALATRRSGELSAFPTRAEVDALLMGAGPRTTGRGCLDSIITSSEVSRAPTTEIPQSIDATRKEPR